MESWSGDRARCDLTFESWNNPFDLPSLTSIAFVLLSIVSCRGVSAQQTVNGSPRSPFHPSGITLGNVLDRISWDSSRQGVLIAIDPQNVNLPASPAGLSQENQLPSDPDILLQHLASLPLQTVVTAYGHRLARFGSVTAVVPERMGVFNDNPGKPDLFAGMDRSQKLLMLEASLSPVQWRKLGSNQGLGAGDLKGDQQDLFLSIIPDPFSIAKARSSVDRGRSEQLFATITPEQRASIRLQLNRETLLVFWRGDRPVMVGGSLSASGQERLTLFRGSWKVQELEPEMSGAFGVVLRSTAPNRLKASDLRFDLDSLARRVSLERVRTLGELVDRIRTETDMELYVDVRAKARPIWMKGESATATDLLPAICLATTGTFRRVGPAFILTHDLAGLRGRIARIGEWNVDASARLDTLRMETLHKVAAKKPLGNIGFEDGDPLALGPDLMSRVEQYWHRSRGEMDRFEVRMGEFPPELQAFIRNELSHRQNSENVTANDKAAVEVTVRPSFLVPGIGRVLVDEGGLSISAFFLDSIERLRLEQLGGKPVELPAELQSRAVYVAAGKSEEMSQAVEAAAKHGLNQVWIDVPDTAAIDALRTAIKAGKQRGVTVSAVIRLFSKEPPKPTGSNSQPGQAGAERTRRDRLEQNAIGETHAEFARRRAEAPGSVFGLNVTGVLNPVRDWVRIDREDTIAGRVEFITKVAATPGLAGIALRDTAAPGYETRGDDPRMQYDLGLDLGYTPDLRLAFLRKEGSDPLDAAPGMARAGSANLIPIMLEAQSSFRLVGSRQSTKERFTTGDRFIAFHPGESPARTLEQRWRAIRNESNEKLLSDLFRAFRASSPRLPLFIVDRSSQPVVGAGWYGSWDRADGLSYRPYNRDKPLLTVARSTSKTVLVRVICPTTVSPPPWVPGLPLTSQTYAGVIRHTLNLSGEGWDGIVFDLSEMAIDQALPLLDGIATRK